MCIQDVKIGRVKTPNGASAGVSLASTGSQLLGPNPRRAVVVLSLLTASLGTGGEVALIAAGGADGPVVGCLSIYHPRLVLRVEEFGRAVMGRITGIGVAGKTFMVHAAEMEWLEDPEKV